MSIRTGLRLFSKVAILDTTIHMPKYDQARIKETDSEFVKFKHPVTKTLFQYSQG